MPIERYAVLDGDTVVNVILWDSADEYDAPSGCTLMPAPEHVAPGWRWIGQEWVASPEVAPPSPPTEDPAVAAAKESAMNELMTLGVSEANARVILGLFAE